MESDDLDTLLATVTSVLERREEVLEAYVFGSVARREAQPHSDIDVAVYVDRDAAQADGPFGWAAELAADLMLALGTNDVDLVVLNNAPPVLYHRVLRDGHRVLSRDLQATTTRAGRAMSRYFDYLPQLDKIDRARRRNAR